MSAEGSLTLWGNGLNIGQRENNDRMALASVERPER